MDRNKLKVLQDIGYSIKKVCGNCLHGLFPQNDWGTCAVTTYDHEKHTGPARQLSIHRTGHCSKHVFDTSRGHQLGAFQPLIER